MWVKNLFQFLIIIGFACPTKGQVKKPLTEVDYKLWSTMESEQLSEKGNWASYSVHYERGYDTLFVRHTKTLKTYAFAGANGKFATDDFFVCQTMNGEIVVTHLKSGRKQLYADISRYSIAAKGRKLILLSKAGKTAGDLLIVGIDGKELLKLPKVALYALNPENNSLVCDSESKLHVVDLENSNPVYQLDAPEGSYTSFAWQNNSASFAYIAEGTRGAVGHYRIQDKKLNTFDRSKFPNFPTAGEIYNASVTELSVSDDGQRVFFGVKELQAVADTTGVQVWNTADKVLYSHRATLKGWTVRAKLGVWFPEEEKFRMVTDTQFPYQILVPGHEYALVWNPLDNEPQLGSDAPIDYYLQNIRTGKQELILPQHSADAGRICISTGGKYIAYFKENEWWVYDIKLGTHREITSQTESTFTKEKYDRSGEKMVCGIAGWTPDDRELLVYDNFDIWLIKTDGSRAERMTRGQEEKIVYRMVPKKALAGSSSVTKGFIDLKEEWLFSAQSDSKSGYFRWSAKTRLQQIVFENNRIGGIKRSENGIYTYTREHYHFSPQIVVRSSATNHKVLYQSNPQQKQYQWGFSKLIQYENSKGKLLNGALFYPTAYDADKSYPLVVHIYERLSDFYNQYVNPSLLNADGFNISNLTTQGYFVLLPDIAYVEGQPGKSALDCVGSAVNEVLAHESVDPKRVGLYGHSFGGYETNYIVTQTNMFKAAISGASVSDIVSSYLTVGWNTGTSDGWRYEAQQFRMGKSLLEDYQNYLRNSPITFANKVETPLLLWAGEADSQIHYYQSLEFYLALRRIQKENILVLYEKEAHTLLKKNNQIDLTHRMQEWFDHYLKGKAAPEWFSADRL